VFKERLPALMPLRGKKDAKRETLKLPSVEQQRFFSASRKIRFAGKNRGIAAGAKTKPT